MAVAKRDLDNVPLLYVGSAPHRRHVGECWPLRGASQVELRLASTYTESKAHLLNDVLEEFFFDDGSFWEAAPLPRGPRDVTFELINTMVKPPKDLPGPVAALETPLFVS